MPTDLQDTIQTLLDTLVAEGKECGVQTAVYLDGKLEVDAWAGTDVRTAAPIDGDTLFPVFSTTKGIFSTVIHVLTERGKIDYEAPIAKYWPEFAANGKETITVRHALTHTAGLPYMPDDDFTPEQICDWDYMCAAIAQLKPFTAAGAKQMYHPITFGWLLGEVARRADGRAVSQLLSDEICRPLGLTRMFCGIPAELEPTTAFLEMIPDPPVTMVPPPRSTAPCMDPLHAWMNRPDARRAAQPGYSGIMNARSVARHYAALLPGGVDGIELVPPSRLRLMLEEQVPSGGYDEGTGRKGLGYGLGDGGSFTGFGHGGYGGSAGYANPPYRLAVGVTLNRFNNNDVAGQVAEKLRSALKISS